MTAMHKTGLLRFLTAALAAVVLGACGGGGNTSSSNTLFKTVTLSGAQEVPAVTTAATGTGFIIVDLDTGAVTGRVTTFGITGSVAHIHQGAVGVAAPVIVPFTQSSPGVWTAPEGSTMTPDQVQAFRNGGLYFNVHDAANPGGEIRGQIGRQVWFATLRGAQEVPPTTSTATGTGTFIFDPDTRTMSGSVATTGIVGTASHIHIGAIGVTAGVAIPFTGGPTNWTMPSTVLTEAQVASLVAGNFYANVHSVANPGGEIRGQLYLPAKPANLSGAQETPPNTSTATGTGTLVINPFTMGVAGRIETTGITAVAAHAHTGVIGVAGPVVVPMTSPSAGVWVTAPGATVTDAFLASFMKGETYLNVHSAAFPGGEIRGQLVSGQ
jgi:hypothetical protein